MNDETRVEDLAEAANHKEYMLQADDITCNFSIDESMRDTTPYDQHVLQKRATNRPTEQQTRFSQRRSLNNIFTKERQTQNPTDSQRESYRNTL